MMLERRVELELEHPSCWRKRLCEGRTGRRRTAVQTHLARPRERSTDCTCSFEDPMGERLRSLKQRSWRCLSKMALGLSAGRPEETWSQSGDSGRIH